jgi:lactaldehyde dehydrogenase/glycolaldehyde dehydrogenase
MVSDETVDMVSMTGSTGVGRGIAQTAAESLIPASLELGGKAPAIVWEDADIDSAVEDLITARISNTGQICTCAERIYVHSAVAEEFTEKYVAAMEDITIGDPREDPDMGPQVSESELESTREAVETATEEGARVLTGGNPPEGEEFENGYWYTPTVLGDVTQDMEIIQDEVFGPVAPIVEIDSMDQALEYANDSEYGLSSYLFTNNYRLVNRIADELDFGETYINRTLGEEAQGHHIGWNNSGLGGSDGEDGKYGFLKYTKIKTLYHDYDDPAGTR